MFYHGQRRWFLKWKNLGDVFNMENVGYVFYFCICILFQLWNMIKDILGKLSCNNKTHF